MWNPARHNGFGGIYESRREENMMIGKEKKKKKKKKKMNEWLMMMVLGITVIGFASGQSVPFCSWQLYPCIDFMNSTNPPQTCCNPIKQINATQKSCFCQIALTPGILEGLGTTTSQALQLLQLCGVHFQITTCTASSSSNPPPSLVKPPAKIGGDEGGTSRATFSGLSFAMFLCVYILFN